MIWKNKVIPGDAVFRLEGGPLDGLLMPVIKPNTLELIIKSDSLKFAPATESPMDFIANGVEFLLRNVKSHAPGESVVKYVADPQQIIGEDNEMIFNFTP